MTGGVPADAAFQESVGVKIDDKLQLPVGTKGFDAVNGLDGVNRPLGVPSGVAERVGLGDWLTVGLGDSLNDLLTVGDGDCSGVTVGCSDLSGDRVGVLLSFAVELLVAVGVLLSVAV
jgi:hypothetical protein